MNPLGVVKSNKLLPSSNLSQTKIDVLDIPQVKANYRALYDDEWL